MLYVMTMCLLSQLILLHITCIATQFVVLTTKSILSEIYDVNRILGNLYLKLSYCSAFLDWSLYFVIFRFISLTWCSSVFVLLSNYDQLITPLNISWRLVFINEGSRGSEGEPLTLGRKTAIHSQLDWGASATSRIRTHNLKCLQANDAATQAPSSLMSLNECCIGIYKTEPQQDTM